jgi:hypothetical protein
MDPALGGYPNKDKKKKKKRAETSGKYLCSVVGEKEKKKIHIQ